jgi:TonB family protein
MGFSRDGARGTLEIADVWWFKDDRMDAGIGLWRRQAPATSARLELRNQFTNMHDRRAPYDGQIIRESPEIFSVTRILEVPGKAAGTISADLLYGLTLRMVGHPTILDADRELQQLIEGTEIVERGFGKEVAGATRVNVAPAVQPQDSWQRLIAEAEKHDAAIGPDIRGRKLSDYLRDLSRNGQPDEDIAQRQRLQNLNEYWKSYPALSHNRDLWTAYLSRNGMPADTPHGSAVMSAESALNKALDGEVPTPEWAERAHALLRAYIEERNQLVRVHQPSPDEYHNRTLPCAAPAEKTSGKRAPVYQQMNRSLEDFWPTESKRLGEEGIVRVSVRISSTGCALAAAIASSSGSEMLDAAVLKFYETIDFLPGEVDGRAIDSTVTLPVAFKLRN